MRELRSHLGRLQATQIDAEADKRAGWRRHGILVIAELVRQLGAKLYGGRLEGDR